MRPARIVATLVVTVLIAATLGACSDSQPISLSQGNGVELGAGQKSMQSPEATKASLERDGWRGWRVVDQPSGKPRGNRPPFEVISIETEGASVGVAGTLRLEFLNGRLMATWFFPVDMNAYRTSLQSPLAGNALSSGPRFGEDFRQRPYAIWEDGRLRNEMDDWIQKYS